MPNTFTSGYSPIELLSAAFSTPLFSLVIALVLAGGVLVHASRPTRKHRAGVPLPEALARSVGARYAPERRTLGLVAIIVVVVFAAEAVIRGYILTSPYGVSWWRVATALFCAVVGVSVLLGLIAGRGTTRPEVAVVPMSRRTWTSFGPRAGLIVAGIVLFTLAATTVAAGLASSADDDGQFVYLAIQVPNEPDIHTLSVRFYGWAYGVPVLICLVALIGVTWAALHRNAIRPYIRPETVAAERSARREVASGAVHIATASMLLALAGAWRLIARGGSLSSLYIEGQNGSRPYDVAWRYAELAVAAGWCAPLLEIAAFLLLVLVAGRLRGRPTPSTSERSEKNVHAGAAL